MTGWFGGFRGAEKRGLGGEGVLASAPTPGTEGSALWLLAPAPAAGGEVAEAQRSPRSRSRPRSFAAPVLPSDGGRLPGTAASPAPVLPALSEAAGQGAAGLEPVGLPRPHTNSLLLVAGGEGVT